MEDQSSRLLYRSSHDSYRESSEWTDSSDEVELKRNTTHWFRPRRKWLSLFSAQRLSSHIFGLRLCTRPSRTLRHLILSFNLLGFVVLGLALLSVLEGLFQPSYANPPEHYRLLEEAVQFSSHAGRGNPKSEKVFIAANIINADFIRGQWGSSLLQLVDYLGPENVFVSIYENDSGPETSAALTELSLNLTCDHSIVTGDHLSLSEFPNVVTPDGEVRVKRLTYLEEVRNRLLWPLDDPISHPSSKANFTSTRFDRVLFINDIFYNPLDALHLLFSTNFNPSTQTTNYSAACAIDFVMPLIFYDSFVVHDSHGYETGLPTFPYFTTAEDARSRNAVLAESDSVPVRSCWGGMVAYQADEFLRPEIRNANNNASFSSPLAAAPLRFRHQPELYWEESECCLINADLAERTDPADPKIYLNPYIRVAYSAKTWSWLPLFQRVERGFSRLQWVLSAAFYPEYNPRRTETAGQLSSQIRWVYDDESLNGEKMRDPDMVIPPEQLGGRWKISNQVTPGGGFCGQRRLFLMKKDVETANKGKSGKNWEKLLPPIGYRLR